MTERGRAGEQGRARVDRLPSHKAQGLARSVAGIRIGPVLPVRAAVFHPPPSATSAWSALGPVRRPGPPKNLKQTRIRSHYRRRRPPFIAATVLSRAHRAGCPLRRRRRRKDTLGALDGLRGVGEDCVACSVPSRRGLAVARAAPSVPPAGVRRKRPPRASRTAKNAMF